MMKKSLLLFAAIFCLSLQGWSVTHLIEAEDFEFDPAFITVNVGDTIVWVWEDGAHTTTSTVIPAGASAWNGQLTSTSPAFMYVPTVPGTYNYICQPHAGMGMQGVITVNGATGLNPNTSASLLLHPRVTGDDLLLDYQLPVSSSLYIALFDLRGQLVKDLEREQMPAGEYHRRYNISGLPAGLYMVRFENNGGYQGYKIIVP